MTFEEAFDLFERCSRRPLSWRGSVTGVTYTVFETPTPKGWVWTSPGGWAFERPKTPATVVAYTLAKWFDYSVSKGLVRWPREDGDVA